MSESNFDIAINLLNSKISGLEARIRDLNRRIEEIMLRIQFLETGSLPTQTK